MGRIGEAIKWVVDTWNDCPTYIESTRDYTARKKIAMDAKFKGFVTQKRNDLQAELFKLVATGIRRPLTEKESARFDVVMEEVTKCEYTLERI